MNVQKDVRINIRRPILNINFDIHLDIQLDIIPLTIPLNILLLGCEKLVNTIFSHVYLEGQNSF